MSAGLLHSNGFPMRISQSLVKSLENTLGHQSARQELKWMKATLVNPPTEELDRPVRSKILRQQWESLPNLETMVQRRIAGEPLQYILGTQPFGPLTLLTRAPTLIPRPETEEWTIRLASFLSKHHEPISSSNPIRILDLCTGSGCIPLLLCHLLPNGTVHSVGVDVSASALELAQENAVICGNWSHDGDDYDESRPEGGLDESGSETKTPRPNTFTTLLADIRKHTELSSLLRSLTYPPSPLSAPKSTSSKPFKPFTVLTANPPYITPSAYERLDPSVRDYEDRGALIGTDDPRAHTPGSGLGFYFDIATLVREGGVLAGGEDSILDDVALEEDNVSNRGGCAVVAMEVGEVQAGDVVDIVREGMPGFGENVEVWKDAFGVDRVVVATRSS